MSNRKNTNLGQYGLLDIPTDISLEESPTDEVDSDLEAELKALTGGGGVRRKKPPPAKAVATNDLDAMVAASLKDIPSDEDVSDGGDDDPDLLSELNEITGNEAGTKDQMPPVDNSTSQGGAQLRILEARLKMYEKAEENARNNNEASRARRFGRGLQTLKGQIKRAQSGQCIDPEEIPPEVTIEVGHSQKTVQNEPDSDKTAVIRQLNERKNEYKMAALQAKKADDKTTALNYIKVCKQFDMVIQAAERGETVDLTRMPAAPPPPSTIPTQSTPPLVQSSPPPPPQTESESLITAATVAEALAQHLEVYKKQEEGAKVEGNASKSRRMGRIVKQFEQAIKMHKAGKPIPVEDLPVPPGYAPLPIAKVEPPPPPPVPAVSVKKTRHQQQLDTLQAKQREFKVAALEAKRAGDLEQAKQLLKSAKGFDRLIEAATSGLPVDLTSIPLMPNVKAQLEQRHTTGSVTFDNDISGDDIISRLKRQLQHQLKMCITTRDHFKAIGDVASANRFERLALDVSKDYDVINTNNNSATAEPPKFHYEKKQFAIVKCCTDLNDNDLQVTVVRGISYTCANPKEIDTYVKFDFTFPSDQQPITNRTSTVKDTNSPEYNESFTLNIQRTSRACQRLFKRGSIKFEIFSKGGLFRSDSLIGCVTVKLQALETVCELHQSFDLLDGRRKVGGKLEVRLRVRHPIVRQQIDNIEEKWLIIDHI